MKFPLYCFCFSNFIVILDNCGCLDELVGTKCATLRVVKCFVILFVSTYHNLILVSCIFCLENVDSLLYDQFLNYIFFDR